MTAKNNELMESSASKLAGLKIWALIADLQARAIVWKARVSQ